MNASSTSVCPVPNSTQRTAEAQQMPVEHNTAQSDVERPVLGKLAFPWALLTPLLLSTPLSPAEQCSAWDYHGKLAQKTQRAWSLRTHLPEDTCPLGVLQARNQPGTASLKVSLSHDQCPLLCLRCRLMHVLKSQGWLPGLVVS